MGTSAAAGVSSILAVDFGSVATLLLLAGFLPDEVGVLLALAALLGRLEERTAALEPPPVPLPFFKDEEEAAAEEPSLLSVGLAAVGAAAECAAGAARAADVALLCTAAGGPAAHTGLSERCHALGNGEGAADELALAGGAAMPADAETAGGSGREGAG